MARLSTIYRIVQEALSNAVRHGQPRTITVSVERACDEEDRRHDVVIEVFGPDLVILDLNLPGGGGLEVIGRLKMEDAAVRILVLGVHDNALYVTSAMQAGATGHVSKSAPPDEILEAVRRVAAGRP